MQINTLAEKSTTPIIIIEEPQQIGGHTVSSYLPEAYDGACRIVSSNSESIAVLPNTLEAYKVAGFAITPNGGYGSVDIEPALIDDVTVKTFDEWFDV